MVPVWMIKLHPLERPEDAYRSAAHWFLLFCAVGTALIGAAFLAGLTLLPPDPGETRSVPAILLSVAMLAFGVLGFVAGLRPRRRTWMDPPPAILVGDDLVLPVRTGTRRLNLLSLAVCAVVGLVTAVLVDGPDRIVGVVAFVLFTGCAAYATSMDPTIRLSPDGLTIPQWNPSERYLPWEEIRTISAVGNFHPHLAVVPRWGSRPITFSLHHQAWSPSAILAAVTYFDRRKAARERLTDPDALEKFRTWRT